MESSFSFRQIKVIRQAGADGAIRLPQGLDALMKDLAVASYCDGPLTMVEACLHEACGAIYAGENERAQACVVRAMNLGRRVA